MVFTPLVIRSFEHHAGDSTIWLDSTPILNYPQNTLEVVKGLPPLFPFHQPHEKKWIDGFLECPYASKALYIFKYPFLLLYSNPGTTTQKSVSLTTIPDYVVGVFECSQNDAYIQNHESDYKYALIYKKYSTQLLICSVPVFPIQ
ncbi:uncharacterized protein TNCV_525021 [Trichonephila clavipes]|nr:uncharacterized protein TNCV_525021 [Trichonephila clavipes]